ncbi:MAG: 4-hydroxythreonine-4-phosphate dehydrogenase [Labilithrix sp.]|nr:4-hydroxythreonine-4-phosphate dehydrogenase [Labilithrix sp.]
MARTSREPAAGVRLAISIGCPSGIGPEVSLAGALALAEEDPSARVLLVGDVGALRAAAKALGVPRDVLAPVRSPALAWGEGTLFPPRPATPRVLVYSPQPPLKPVDRAPGKPTRAAGAAQLAWIDRATDLAACGQADALVTGPVSKDAIARSGAPGSKGFLGHTEHLAARLGAREVTMAFRNERLTTSLVTTHLPLSAVPRAIKAAEVARAAFWTADLVARLASGTKKHGAPRIVVASLNPHAGENGLLGDEEGKAITPGIVLARKRIAAAGLEVVLTGPMPAESAFRIASGGGYDAVVAMYHDQATIPMKLLGFGEAVNISLGLPIIRTSVDHGTAYDRAYQGTADPRGMLEALRLAARLARAGQ